MAEREQSHRHLMQSTILDVERQAETRGSLYGLYIAIVALAAGFVVITAGGALTGSILAGAPMLGLVGIFVYGRWKDISKETGSQHPTASKKAPSDAEQVAPPQDTESQRSEPTGDFTESDRH